MADDGRRPWRVQSQPVSTSGIPAAASADDRAVTAERCAAQLLGGDRAGSPVEVARRLLAIQAQDLRGARLAIRARSAGLSASDVGSARTRRSMIVTWLNRGTLHLVRAGPVAGRDQAFVLTRDWLGAPPPAMGREAALGELARRYLAGHGPAADRDLARWAGIGRRDARLGLARCGAVQRADRLAEMPARPRRVAAAPPPRLPGAFDPLLPGWASRDPITGPHRRIVTAGGLFRPFALAGGRAVATWTIRMAGSCSRRSPNSTPRPARHWIPTPPT